MTQYSDIIVTPVYGPLSTSNYPSVTGRQDLGTLSGLRPTPPFFYPGQEPVASDEFVTCRHQYKRVAESTKSLAIQRQRTIQSAYGSMAYYSYSSQTQVPVTNYMNYIAPKDSSQYLAKKKAYAIGKSSYKVGLPLSAPLSTKNYCPSNVRSVIRSVRGGGCVAPKKKGAIENTSLRCGPICAWGSNNIRSTY